MAYIKTPGGSFYLNDEQFDVDYNAKTVEFIGGGPSKQGVAVPDVSGSEAADAITTINALLASLRAAGLIASD